MPQRFAVRLLSFVFFVACWLDLYCLQSFALLGLLSCGLRLSLVASRLCFFVSVFICLYWCPSLCASLLDFWSFRHVFVLFFICLIVWLFLCFFLSFCLSVFLFLAFLLFLLVC